MSTIERIIADHLHVKNIPYKKTTNHFNVQKCIECDDDKYHMYINEETGAWDCKKCGAAGSFYTLKKKTGIIIEKNVKVISEPENPRKPEGYAYLLSRGISQKTREDFGIISNTNSIGFVYRTLDGEPYAVKTRNLLKEKKIIQAPEGALYYPYYFPKLIPKLSTGKKFHSQIIVCEGEMDALTYHEYGFPAIMAIPGANGFKESWKAILDKYDTVILSMDMDDAGQAAKNKLIKKIGIDRCKIIELPLKDINECMMAGFTKDEIIKIVNNASTPPNEHVVSVKEYKLTKHDEKDLGVSTGFANLDELTKFRPGELLLLTANTKNGKTIFMLNLLYKLLYQKLPCLVASFEMGLKATMQSFASICCNKSYYEMTDNDINNANLLLPTFPLFMANKYGKMELAELKQAVYLLHKNNGVNHVFIDHFHFFSTVDDEHNLAHEYGKIMQEIKSWTIELNIFILMIVHPRAVPEGAIITEEHLRGSSDIKQMCDGVITIHADRINELARVDARCMRHPLAKIGFCGFGFNTKTLKFEPKIVVDTNFLRNAESMTAEKAAETKKINKYKYGRKTVRNYLND